MVATAGSAALTEQPFAAENVPAGQFSIARCY